MRSTYLPVSCNHYLSRLKYFFRFYGILLSCIPGCHNNIWNRGDGSLLRLLFLVTMILCRRYWDVGKVLYVVYDIKDNWKIKTHHYYGPWLSKPSPLLFFIFHTEKVLSFISLNIVVCKPIAKSPLTDYWSGVHRCKLQQQNFQNKERFEMNDMFYIHQHSINKVDWLDNVLMILLINGTTVSYVVWYI